MDFNEVIDLLKETADVIYNQYLEAEKDRKSRLYDRFCAVTDAIGRLEEEQEEIERLNDTLRIMFNRCICFCGSQNCSECKQREECESKRSFWQGYYLLHGKRVKKGGDQE